MRKPFTATLALVMILGSLLPGVRPVLPRPVSASAPLPPTPSAPTSPPAGLDLAGESLPTPPAPGSLSHEAKEARARQAIEAVLEKYLRYWGPRYQVAPVEVKVEGEWAYGVAPWQSEATVLNSPLHVLAHRLADGTWQALMPESDGLYLQWLEDVPESLVPNGERDRLRTQAQEANPFQHGIIPLPTITSTMPVSRPWGPGQPSGPLTPSPTPIPLFQPTTWISGETTVSRLSKEERARLCGVPVTVIEWERLQASREAAELGATLNYPSAIDWRNVNGQDWTTPIRNQAGCGSCVAFGTVAAIESRMEIANSNSGLNPDLSEAHLFYCGCGECCSSGWYPDAALNFARNTGIADENCYPYTDYDQACSPCTDWQSRITKITDWIGTSNVAEMKQALADSGPLEATMAVYEDFFSYSGGIYRHTWGNLEGYHAVTIVGYDDNGDYWIAKNSWGAGWGEGGWFRIAYDECEIDNYAYIPTVNPPPSCNYNADQIALFVDTSYRGQCVVKAIGEYPNPSSIGLPNDSISSVKVGGNVRAVLCRDDNYEGGCEAFSSDDPDLSNNSIGDNQVSSVKVEPPSCDPSVDQVALYADPGYGGSCVTLDIGYYPNPGYLGSLGNDNAESIRVGSNVQATLCEHDNYEGRCETFTGDDSNLGDNPIGANVVSSIIVQSRDTTPPTGHITSPSDGDTINACPLAIQAEASDNQSGVSHVEFHAYYDGSWHHLGDDYTSPYSWNWDCSPVSDQGVWLTTHVWDNAGNEVMDPGGYVYITLDRTLPTGQITSPSDGAVISACPLTIEAAASDTGSGVALIEFHAYYDGSWHHWGDDYTSPYSWDWDCSPISDQGVWLTIHVWDNARNEVMDPGGYVYVTLSQTTIGPLAYDSHAVDDDNNGQSSGDGDGVVECGESIELYVDLYNQGNGTATGVNAAISTSDPHITWLYNTASGYPDIPGGGTATNSDDFDFTVDPSTPHGHAIQFDLTVNASNGGPWSGSFSVSVACPWPDLVPAQWGDWQYPIVPSSVPGTGVVNTLYAGYPTYIDWGLTNQGNTNTGGNTYGDLYIDSARVGHYDFGDVLAGQSWAFIDWVETVNDPGWHTLRVVTDPDNLIAESDETNNAWQQDFYWTPVAPYTDDMESGTNDWGATGLWHQVGPGSPYSESRSGTHSWWYGQDSTGNYNTGAANSGDLTSPPIYIPSAGYYLRFWYRYETETQGPGYDQRWVQISVDDGPFNNVLQLWDDPKDWWLQSPALNLAGYAGHIVRVRFHFDTLDSYFNDYRGWHIDDLDISTTSPPTCADSHEPNNAPPQATTIASGQTLSADICPGGDYDFYRFTSTAGDKVVVDIDAKVNGSLLDSYVFLLDSDGTSVLAEHDDEILVERQDSHLGYQLPHDGTYYVKVRAWDHPSVGGTDHFYTIRLLADNTSPSAQITSPGHNAWLNPNQQTITTVISDTGSGIRNVTFYWHDAHWDGSSDWIVLDDDWDPADGWTYSLDTSSISEQSPDCVVFIYAYDWAGNYTGYGSYSLGLDRTPPTVSAGVIPMYGNAPFRDFSVTWWNGWDNLSGLIDYDVQYRDGTSGAWTDLLTNTEDTYTRFVGFDGHTYYFRARARDHAGNQSAYASDNGDVQHTVEICDTPPDAYEVDDTRANARWIIPDRPMQMRTFYAQGDRDWVKFYAAAGITYTLMTTNTGGHADTVLYLYDRDGTTLITSNDDDPNRWPASRIDWRPTTGGFYWAKVEHWDPWAYGCTTGYGLSIAGSRPTPFSQVYLPLTVRNFDPSHPPTTAVRTLNFRVRFYSRDNAAGQPQNVPIKVIIKNLSLDQVLLESGWVSVTPTSGSNNWGTASVDVSRAGLVSGRYYQVFVRGAMHLTRRVAVLFTDGTTVNYTDLNLNPDGVLWTCDINQDNQVNGADVNIVLSHYFTTAPTNPDPSSELYRSDQNGDGMVNGIDVTICIRSYGKVGDPY